MLWHARRGIVSARGALDAAPGGGGIVATTWNSATKHANVTLTGGNLITTGTGGYAGARTIKEITIGSGAMIYWEMRVDTLVTGGGNNTAGGLSIRVFEGSTESALDSYIGSNFYSVGWAQDGTVYLNGGSLGSAAGYVAADTLCYAFDLPNLKMHFRKNGGNWNNNASHNPSTNTGGFSVSTLGSTDTKLGYKPMVMTGNGTGDVYTANFGSTTFAQAKPIGFSELLA